MAGRRLSIFFMRLILFFSVVLLLSFTAVLIYNSEYIDQKGINQMDAEALAVVMEAQSFFEDKIGAVKHMIAMLYNTDAYQRIPSGMSAPPATFSSQELMYSAAVDEYLQLGQSSDPDIVSIGLYTSATEKAVMLASGVTRPGAHQAQFRRRIEEYGDLISEYGPTPIMAEEDDSYVYTRFVLPTLSKIKSHGMARTLGYLSVDFTLSRMDARVSQYAQRYPGGRLYVTDKNGAVLYDSKRLSLGGRLNLSGGATDETALYFQVRGEEYLRVVESTQLGLNIALSTPMDSVRAGLQAQKMPIILGVLALLILGVLATGLYVKRYSRRILTLSRAMERVRGGALDVRIPPDGNRDEISMLFEGFNQMCDMLSAYIDEVYVTQIRQKQSEVLRLDAELKQRSARLYALQTQISPHFLYNSLESIRMRALSRGERDIARMANILSDLLRNSLRSDFVVSVAEEAENCDLYIRLVKLRHPEGLEVEVRLEEETLNLAIASQVLQPLVENAINHASPPNDGISRILVSARCEAGPRGRELALRVSDNGPGIEADKLLALQSMLSERRDIQSRQIGLANVNQRVRLLFGDDWGLSIYNAGDMGAVAEIRVPAMSKREVEERVQGIDR